MPTLTRRQKATFTQIALYLVLIGAVAAVALLLDWEKAKTNFFSPGGFGNPFNGDWGTWPEFIATGVKNTVIYTALAFVFGLALALAFKT